MVTFPIVPRPKIKCYENCHNMVVVGFFFNYSKQVFNFGTEKMQLVLFDQRPQSKTEEFARNGCRQFDGL